MKKGLTAKDTEIALKRLADPERATKSLRFFKTGPGQYGEGDRFYGIRVPEIRRVVKSFEVLQLEETKKLLYSPMHESRLLALLILIRQFEKGDEETRKRIFGFYKNHAKQVNNWDLVDLSAPNIAGAYLFDKDRKQIATWAKSRNLWERRIAVVSTLYFIKHDELDDTFNVCKILIKDKEDLMHKACGWMLREAGKRDMKRLEAFLKANLKCMPRTMLRYAIEKFPETKRRAYLNR